MPSTLIRVLPRLALAVTLAGAACGESAEEAIRSERAAADLVVGSTAAEWGLLTVPRGGGTAELRPIVSPDSVAWTGSAELPVATGAWAVGEQAIVLLDESGTVVRYLPAEDRVDRLATLSDRARAAALTSSAVVFLDSAGRFAYEVGSGHERGYTLDPPAAWAGAIDGGLAVLSEGDTADLRLLPRADSGSVNEIAGAGRPPALVTAWGRRVAVTGPDGRSVRVYATGDGELVGEAELAGPVRELAASPSSHEMYAALAAPPRLQRISRFSLETDDPIELDSAADRIRPGLFGGSLLVETAAGTRRLRTGSRVTSPLPGSWRTDLPLGLPGDLTVVLVEDEVRLASVADSAGAPLAGGAPHWWLPVHFEPTPGVRPDLREALDELGAAAGAPAEAASGEGGETSPEAEDVDVPQIGREAAAAQEGPPGFYAIVVSARERTGVEELLATLNEAGYPTRVQTYPDEAGELWHRGLVGPFPSRARAQAAARQLLRERELQAWVTEIGASE